ncbi:MULTISPECIES: hypothetical protein [Bradyrhizobium]|uniref:hypothetical protein n=1 Tax=Bradyrhizobium TaxID=374 RepID=UPI000D3377F4|nr:MULTISPECIES: hypothetical protein [Bradyrhizobium]WOH52222.1 hypothetical protein RX328_08210 [Bradyrhizobium sp. sBnM-33]
MEMMDQTAGSDLPPVLHTSSRRVSWLLLLVVVLVGLCAAGAYFWTNVGQFVETVAAAREVATMPSLSPEDRAALSEIQSGQQKASDELAELNRSISAQLADLTRISDQIAALTLRIDSLQNPAPTASPPHVPRPTPGHAVSEPAKTLVRSSKPQGPVSVGGAPLVSGPKPDEP